MDEGWSCQFREVVPAVEWSRTIRAFSEGKLTVAGDGVERPFLPYPTSIPRQ